MTRQQRQLDELRALCAQGRVARAVDLAFEHFACFGSDEVVLALLLAADDKGTAPGELRSRLRDLAALADADPVAPDPPAVRDG